MKTWLFQTEVPLVALYRGTSWVSRLVRWQTRSVYSHAALYLTDGSVIESWHKGGVQWRDHAGAVHTRGTVVDLFAVTPALNWHAAIEWALSQEGKGYDWRGVARFVSRGQPDCDPDRWFCSSLIMKAVQIGGVSLLERICPTEVAPHDLGISPLLAPVGSITTA